MGGGGFFKGGSAKIVEITTKVVKFFVKTYVGGRLGFKLSIPFVFMLDTTQKNQYLIIFRQFFFDPPLKKPPPLPPFKEAPLEGGFFKEV